jgi:hypothetical protein
VDNAAHIGGLLSGVALALIIPYKRPNERITPRVWVVLQILCLLVIFGSFVAAFLNYNGPRLSLSNLTSGQGSSVVTYFERMQDARRQLNESFSLFEASIDGKNDTDGSKQALDATERALRAVNAAPLIDPQADQFRTRLLELINKQKSLVIEFSRSSARNRDSARREQRALGNQAQQFENDYGSWLPGFLKQHGYGLRETDDR